MRQSQSFNSILSNSKTVSLFTEKRLFFSVRTKTSFPYDVKGVCFFTEELSIKYKKNCLEDEFNSCVYWAPNQMQMKVPSTSGNRSRGRAEHTL